MIVFDTARRDAVQPFGAPAQATPAVADLARRGQAYPRAYATSSWTLPSHVSMFSGLLPRRVGLTQAPGGPAGVRPVMESLIDRLLPGVLSAHGYANHGWVTNHWVTESAGFGLGFDDFTRVDSGRTARAEELLAGGPRAQIAWAREGLASRDDDGAAEVGRQLRDSIGTWDGRPTFWFVNLTECHSPYLPPRPWNDLPPRARIRAALEVRRHLNFLSICLYAAGRRKISPEALWRMKHLYRRSISYMDDWLAGILGALDERGILDETLVIVTSDQGENFGEKGLISHGFSVDQRLVNVPLVMAGPGTPAESLTSLAELPRMVAKAAGIEDHPWREQDLPDGLAVSQYDPMAALNNPRVQQFGEEHGLTSEELAPLCAAFTSVTDGRFKLVVRDGVEQLFDLDSDPDELAPLASGHWPGAAAAALQSALEHPGVQGPGRGEDGITSPASSSPLPEPSADEVEAIERQMKLLGYM
jgi:arylsulfatase A-like enzyme